MGRFPKYACAGVMLLLLTAGPPSYAQSRNGSPSPDPVSKQQTNDPAQSGNRLRTSSTVVLVPALVKTKSGETVFSLTADGFILTDNGVPQTLQLETDTDSQPLALVVIVETGGQGTRHLRDYDNLGAELDAVIGDVRHLIAVVSFDSKPRIAQDFTDDTDAAAKTIANLNEGDQGAAILDALNFGIDLLRDVPPRYRRAVLLVTETADRGSETSLDDAVRSVSDTNYIRLITTAVRSSCCLVPPEKSTTALERAEMMSPADSSLDARIVSFSLSLPNCTLCAFAHS